MPHAFFDMSVETVNTGATVGSRKDGNNKTQTGLTSFGDQRSRLEFAN